MDKNDGSLATTRVHRPVNTAGSGLPFRLLGSEIITEHCFRRLFGLQHRAADAAAKNKTSRVGATGFEEGRDVRAGGREWPRNSRDLGHARRRSTTEHFGVGP
jgi:hypothetical protein